MLVSVLTLGCKVNEVESRSIMKELSNSGIDVTEQLISADAYVLNTCAVTVEADRKCRQYIGKIRKQNPLAPIYVCGCSSQNNPSRYLEMENVVFVSGSGKKREVISAVLSGSTKEKHSTVSEISCEYEELAIPDNVSSRIFVKIQDGCNNFCSYCIIPFVRGRERSRSQDEILKEIEASVGKTKEIVLTGINVSSYGKDIGSSLKKLCSKLGDYPIRKRLSSLECNVIDDELLETLKNSGFCDHFHLSLQSGCDNVLKAMNRHYTTKIYAEKVDLIRKHFSNAGITTDIITGFPTETEEDFLTTCDFAKSMAFSDIHIFPYSERPGTRAARMPQIEMNERRMRAARLAEIKKKLVNDFLKKQLGKTLEVFFEEEYDGIAEGYSSNYVRVYSSSAHSGELLSVTPTKLYRKGVK